MAIKTNKRKGIAAAIAVIAVAAGICAFGLFSENTASEAMQEMADAESVIAEQVRAGAQDADSGQVPIETKYAASDVSIEADDSYDFTICFAGDINLDENWYTTKHLDTCANGIYDCIDAELIEEMNAADIMWLNNEFTYSNRGSAMAGKAYTFRADPSRVDVLDILGVDIVGLANNHVYDYGEEAFLDTLDTLEEAGILFVGAGRNLEEAMTPVYMELQGKTIAFVAASRAEKNKMTPQATENTPGILRCYDTALFDEEIAMAAQNADIVIALPHWGTEYSTVLEQVQIDTAKEYIDAGADVIIGAHTHCLQGFGFYEGSPIIYSLGNYWFNEKTLDTMLVTLHCYGDSDADHIEVKITPGRQENCQTKKVTDPLKQRELYDYLESISTGVDIDDEGRLTANEK